MFKNKNCTINLQSSQSQNSILNIDLNSFKSDFTFQLYNQSHLMVQNKNQTEFYFVLIASLIDCFDSFFKKDTFNKRLLLVLNSKLNELNDKQKKDQNFQNGLNSTDLPFYLRSEIQPVLYVSVILSVFTIIFALILLITQRYNKQDAEMLESKMIIKRWNHQLKSPYKSQTKRNSLFSFSSRFDEMKKISCFNLYRKQPRKTIYTNSKFNSKYKRNSELVVPKLIFDDESLDSDCRTIKLENFKNDDRISFNSLRTV